MQIRQAVAVARDHRPATVSFLHELVEDLKASGQIAESLASSGQDASVAP